MWAFHNEYGYVAKEYAAIEKCIAQIYEKIDSSWQFEIKSLSSRILEWVEYMLVLFSLSLRNAHTYVNVDKKSDVISVD